MKQLLKFFLIFAVFIAVMSCSDNSSNNSNVVTVKIIDSCAVNGHMYLILGRVVIGGFADRSIIHSPNCPLEKH